MAQFILLLFSPILMHREGIRKFLAEPVLVFLQDLLLTEAFIISPNVDNLYLPNQPDLKHPF